MCAVGMLMLFMKISSFLLTDLYRYFTSAYNAEIESALVRAVKAVFGTGSAVSAAAARSIMLSGIPYSIFSMLCTLLTLFLPAYIFAKFSKDDCFGGLELDGGFLKGILPAFALFQLFMTAASVCSDVFYDFLLPASDGDYYGSYANGAQDGFSFFVSLIETCVFVPIVEEYVFRGVFLEKLRIERKVSIINFIISFMLI